MRLWIESAQQSQGSAREGTPGSLISTLTTEEGFLGLVMSGSLGPGVESRVKSMGGRPWSSSDIDDLASALIPSGQGHAPLALLQVRLGDSPGASLQARLVECDAPPLFMARRGRLVLLPVVEEEFMGRLVRTCEFDLRDGDHLAMVSEGYLQGIGAGFPSPYVGWREVAVAIRRLTDTRCSAEQLAGALIRQYQRLAGGQAGSREQEAGNSMGVKSSIPNGHTVRNLQSAIAVLAMFVRPMRTVTIWTGPPADRAVEKHVLDALMREEDMRVVCGDTTAEIAARMLGAELVMEPPLPEGWAEVPPVSRMILPDGAEAVTMVTEGVVTMRVARERLAGVARARDLVGRADGASRLAHLLLTADRVRFLVGLAVNRAQVSADGMPLRWVEVRDLVDDLKARGKIVSLERF